MPYLKLSDERKKAPTSCHRQREKKKKKRRKLGSFVLFQSVGIWLKVKKKVFHLEKFIINRLSSEKVEKNFPVISMNL